MGTLNSFWLGGVRTTNVGPMQTDEGMGEQK